MLNNCKRCLYPNNHALNIIIDDEGICSGCRIHEEKDSIDWNDRWNKLNELVSSFKNISDTNYDCIIPINGSKDKFFIVDTVINKLKMKPLLVHYNSQFNTPEGVNNLAKIRLQFGADLIQKTINPDSVKKITRATFRKFGSIYWHVIAGETVYPVQMAVQLKIPLIIWGAHQGIDQVGMYSHDDYVEMSRKYRKDHDCMGIEAEDLIDEFDNINEQDIAPFKYPSNRDIERVGVRGIYLNNYIRWDSRGQHEDMALRFNYEGRLQTRTFDSFSNSDCYLYSDLHDYIKYIKHGYGKINDHVAREIRLGQMTQEVGLDLIEMYLHKEPEYLSLFLDWIGMTEQGFLFVLDLHRNMNFWKRDMNWKWKFSNPSITVFKDKYDYPFFNKFKKYVNTKHDENDDFKSKFILIGRGYK
jgi:N-acetyl sugar amidotransferase